MCYIKPKNSKLSYSNVRLASNTLEYISQTKYFGFMFNIYAQDDENMLRQMHAVHCIFDQINYYALFIIVLLMLNWNCLEVTVPHFTVVIYGLHTKSQHSISYL